MILMSINAPAQNLSWTDQKFEISKFHINENQHEGSTKGIQVKFTAKSVFKDTAFNIESSELEYYFYIKITSGKTVIYPLQSRSDFLEGPSHDFGTYKIYTYGYRDFNFFIPYYRFARGESNEKLTFTLMACNYAGTKTISNISSLEVTLALPEIWVNHLAINNMSVDPDIGYDFSFIGLGHPDVYWMVQVDENTIYMSNTNYSNHAAYDGKMNFNTLRGEKVSIEVWDKDQIGKDDLIGIYDLKESSGEKTVNINQKKISFGSVDRAFVSYSKSPKFNIPKVKTTGVSLLYDVKKDSVSGLSVSLDYALSNIYLYHDIKANAYNKSANTRTELLWSKYGFNTQKADTFIISSKNPEGSAVLFFPYCEVKGDEIINFELRDDLSETLIAQTNNAAQLEKKEINDADFEDVQYNEVFYEGKKGINITLMQKIPAFYRKNYKTVLRQSFEIQAMKNRNSFSGIVVDSMFKESKTFFIPYCKLPKQYDAEGYSNLQIERNIYLSNNSATTTSLGANNDTLRLKVPQLSAVSFSEIIVRFKKKPVGSYYFGLIHGKDTIIMNEGILQKKNMTFSINTNLTIFHPDDDMQFILITDNDPAGSINLRSCKGMDLSSMNGITFKQKKTLISKYSLVFFIKNMNE